jgi:hypothetical protein
MRLGRTRENISFQDLPIGDDEPNRVPWPHFQEIDFYHVWPAPHPRAELVNAVIERKGRWTTPEEEAELMRDARRGVRLLKEMEEAEKKSFVVVDDDDDEEEVEGEDEVEGGVGALGTPGDQEEAAVMRRMKDMLADGAAVGAASDGVAARKTPKEEAHQIDIDDIDFDLGGGEEGEGEGGGEDSIEDDDEDDEDDSDFLMDCGLDEEDDDEEEEEK